MGILNIESCREIWVKSSESKWNSGTTETSQKGIRGQPKGTIGFAKVRKESYHINKNLNISKIQKFKASQFTPYIEELFTSYDGPDAPSSLKRGDYLKMRDSLSNISIRITQRDAVNSNLSYKELDEVYFNENKSMGREGGES